MEKYIEVYRNTEGNVTRVVTTDIGSIILMAVFFGIIAAIIIVSLCIHFSPEKIREITIVRKRKSVRDIMNDPRNTTGHPRPPTYELHTITVDFVYVGKKHIHTCFIDEQMYKRFREGGTYKVRMKYPHILEIVRK